MDDPLFKALAAAARKPISDFNLQCLGNTAWSFSRLQVIHRPVLASLAVGPLRTISELNAQGPSNTAWAFATMSVLHRPLMHSIAWEFLGVITAIRPQNTTNTVWAYATLIVRHQPLLTMISSAPRANIEGELSKWDPGLLETADEWVKALISAKEVSGTPTDENAITTAMLWAFWESSRTPARI